MGRVCVRDLAASDVEEVVVADLDLDAARRVADSIDGGRDVRPIAVDATDIPATAAVLEGADVVANCTNYAVNPSVMRAAARAGVAYLDLGGLYHGTRRQMKLHSEMEEAGILCLLGMGSTPGTMNVMAAAGVERLDEVTDISLRCGGLDPAPSEAPLPVPYAVDTILDEFTIPAVVLRDGELAEVEAASGEEMFPFAPPVGPQRAITTLHSELATMPASFGDRGVRNITFKVAFGDHMTAAYRTVAELGLGSTDPVALADGTSAVPREVLKHLLRGIPQTFSGRDIESLVVELKGTREGRSLTVRVEEVSQPHDGYGVGGADANTGIPPSVAAQMIARGEIKGIGVKAPEEVVPPGAYFRELGRRGITIAISETPA